MSISERWKRELLLASAAGCLWSAANAETVITIPPNTSQGYSSSVSFPDALRVTGGGTLYVGVYPLYNVPITFAAPGGITIDTATGLVVDQSAVLVTPGIVNNGTLRFTNVGILHYDPVQTVSAVISGTGSFTADAPVILTADNTYTGGTFIGRNLQIGNGGTTGSIVGNVSASAGTLYDSKLTFYRSDRIQFNGDISLPGGTVENRGGLVVLTGSVNAQSVYGGGDGIQFGDGGAGGTLNITGSLNGDVIFDRSDVTKVTVPTQGLTQKGTGLLILTTHSDYIGIASGSTLQFGEGGNTGYDGGHGYFYQVVNDGTLIVNSSDTVYIGQSSGSGRLVQAGTGTIILYGNATYTGGTTIASGVLQLGSETGLDGTLVGNIVDNGMLVFNNGGKHILAGDISGTGGISQIGAGTTVLTGKLTYTGPTVVTRGVLITPTDIIADKDADLVIDDTVTQKLTIHSGFNGIVSFNRADTYVFANTIESGGFAQIGSGVTILTGNNNTDRGGITINSGTLQLGNGGTSGSVTGNILDNAVLSINRSDTLTFGGTISGLGKLVQAGPGMTVLNGNVSLAGGASVAAGTLAIGDSSSPSAMFVGNVTVAMGATLRGHGSIAGTVTNVSGGTVRPGLSIGTITVSDYIQGATSTLAMDITPTASSLLRVQNGATLDGSLSLFLSPGTYGAHKYTVLSYSTHSGQFSDITLGGGPSGMMYGISYGDTSASLVTEPAAQAQVYSDVGRSVRDMADVIGGQVYAHQSTRYCHGEGDKGRAGEWICPELAVWYQGVGGISAYDRSDLSAGFNARYAGFVGGFDVDLGGGFAVGLTAAYVRELLNVSGGGADVSTNSFSLGLTGDVPILGGWLDGRLLWIKTDGETNRVVADTGYTALGHPKADTYSGSLTYSHPIVYSDLQGMAGVTFTAANLHAMSESNADVFSLGVGSHSWAQVHGDVGLKYGHIFHLRSGAILVPEVTAGVRGYFGSLSDEARVRLTGGPDFMAPAAPVDRYAFVGGLSVTAERRDGFTLALHTQERVSRSVLEASVSLEGRYPF